MPSPIPGPPPFATSTLPGLVSIIAQQFSGDKEFLGKIQATGNPVGLGVFTNGTLPSAAAHPGAILYNTTVAKIQFSNGSIWASLDAGAGSFVQTTGDTMTGQLNIVGAGIAVDTADNTFFVDATTNRVGLGTAAPNYPLEIVLSNPNNNSVHILNPDNPGYSAIRFSDYLGTQQLTLGYGNPLATAPFGSKNFLHLAGTDLIVTTGTSVLASFKANGDFFVDTNTLYVDAANNRVGILTASPAFPLSVNGIISSSSGGFRFPDATTQTTAFVPTSYVAKIGDTMSGQLNIQGAGINVDSLDNTFVVDATNNRVAIGHASPTRVLDIRSSLADHLVQLQNLDVTGSSSITYHSNGGIERFRVGYGNPSFPAPLAGLNFLSTDASTDMIIAHSTTEYHRFFATGGNVKFDQADNLLFIDSVNNRIGFLQGTPSSTHFMDINPTVASNGQIIKLRNNSTSGYSGIEFFSNGGVSQGSISFGNSSVTGGGSNDLSINYASPGFKFRQGTTEHHHFQSNGNITFDTTDNTFFLDFTNNRIGIGTNSFVGAGGYTSPLHVNLGTTGTRSVLISGGGTIQKAISLQDSTNNRTWSIDHRPSGENNRFEGWYHNGTTAVRQFTWTTNGRLGVGDITPVVELDVLGAGQFTGSLTVDTNTLLVNAANSNVGIGGTANSAMKLHVFDGNMKIQGTGDAASIRLQRTETVDGSIDPEFKIGTIVSGGVNLPMLKFTFTDQTFTDKDCFIIESSGTVASVSDGNRRSHYEAFIQTGDVDPVFRLNSSPYMTLELGPGGAKVSIAGLSRTSNVTTAVTDVPHGLQVGSEFHMSNSEANFPAFIVSTKTVASIISPTSFTYADTGADATSTIVHYISGITDVHFKRSDAFTAQLSLGGGAKMTWYPDTMVAEPGYDIKANVVGGIPLFWASAGYDRVAMGVAVPASKLHVKGTATSEIVSVFQSPASHTNNITEWWNSAGSPLASMSQTGVLTSAGLVVDTDTLFVDATANRVGIGVASSLAARLQIKGEGATGSTTALLVENSSGTDYFTVTDNGSAVLTGTFTAGNITMAASGNITAATGIVSAVRFRAGASGGSALINGRQADGAGAIGVKIANDTALTIDGAKIAAFYNDDATTEKASVTKDGVFRSVNASVTPAAGTGITVNYNGDHRQGYYKVTFTQAAFTAAATTEDLTVCTIPAKARVISVIADTTVAFTGGGATTATLRLGKTTNGQEYILDHSVFTTGTKGLVDGDLGTSINRANAVQGGDIPSWTASTDLKIRLTSDVNVADLTAGSITFYITVEFI